jgi:hypothetical protein
MNHKFNFRTTFARKQSSSAVHCLAHRLREWNSVELVHVGLTTLSVLHVTFHKRQLPCRCSTTSSRLVAQWQP